MASASGLRPTPDRVRETIFNWLMPVVDGAQVLDLCAGTGALGLEALSRGASHALFVEQNRRLCEGIREYIAELNAQAEVSCRGVEQLATTVQGRQFDLVFIDPPYQANLYSLVFDQLVTTNCLRQDSWIYLESHARDDAPDVPVRWMPYRSRVAGDVRYELYRLAAADGPGLVED